LAAVADTCQQSINKISPQACPFCDEWSTKLKEANPGLPSNNLVVTVAQFQHHVGSHMEQLALFALPRDHGDSDASTGAAARHDDRSESDLGSRTSYEEVDNPPLHIAAFEGLEAEVLHLLEDGANVTAPGETWGNVLTAAIIGGHPSIVQILLEHGAAVDLHAASYGYPLEAALRKSDEQSITILRDAMGETNDIHDSGSKSDKHRRTFLVRASARGDVTSVKEQLFDNPRSKDVSDDLRDLPLHHAAIDGHTEVAELLLEAGCDVNCQNDESLRPLHDAATKGFFEVVNVLPNAPGCDLECRNGDGDTPLHNAVKYGRTQIVSLLMAAGANFECQNNKGIRPLHYAAKFGHLEVARSLLDAGCRVHCQDSDGNTPLHFAVHKGNSEIVDLLFSMEANPMSRNQSGRTPFDLVPVDLGNANAQALREKLGQYRDHYLRRYPNQKESDVPTARDQIPAPARSTDIELEPALKQFFDSSKRLEATYLRVTTTLNKISNNVPIADELLQSATLKVAIDESQLAWLDICEWPRSHVFDGKADDNAVFQCLKRCLNSRLLDHGSS